MTNPNQVQKPKPFQLRLGERRVLLISGDFIVAVIAVLIALWFWASSEKYLAFTYEFIEKRVPIWFFGLPFVWLILLVEMYDVHRAGDWQETVKGIATATLIGLGIYLLLYFTYVERKALLPRRGVASFLVMVSLLTLIWRGIYINVFTAPRFMRRVLVVGGGKSGQILLHIIQNLKLSPFDVVGVIDDDPQKMDKTIEGIPVIGKGEQLLDLVCEKGITDIIVAITGEMNGVLFQALLDAQEMGVEIVSMPKVYEELLGRVPIKLLEADWIIRNFVDQARVSSLYEVAKRLMDLLGGVATTVVFLIVFPFVALAIALDDGLPLFYGQTRAGRGGVPYTILKFRTMRRDAESDGKPRWAKEDDERATRVGRFLRKTHIDELPQCFNVLRGEMSLVGPRAERPELVQVFQKQVPFYRARLIVKPGVTGWAQVNFGYASTVEETITKLEYDLYYIKHRSLMLDIIIILRTPATVFGLRGR